ncbi:hypothetical protein ACLOJK_029519, partial [Asimina triloba]
AGGALLPTQAKQSWPLMGGADGMDEGGGCGQRAAGRGGGERVGSDVGSWRGRGGGSVLARGRGRERGDDGRGRGDDGRGRDARSAAGGLCTLVDERPGSTDPGLADDGNEDNKLWEIRRSDELGKKTLCAAAMARFRSEMGHDRSGIELNLLMTGEEDSPRVAAVINVGLRSQQIWNVRIVAVVMSGLDGPMECLTAVGFRRWQARLTAMRGGRRR